MIDKEKLLKDLGQIGSDMKKLEINYWQAHGTKNYIQLLLKEIESEKADNSDNQPVNN